MTDIDETTARAEAIASQVVNLQDTEVLVLRCPPGMDTLGHTFDQFRNELRRLLPEGTGNVRAIVLRSDMELTSYGEEDLAKVGLASIDRIDTAPEELFTDGALQAAARAGWKAAMGQDSASDQHIAKESLRLLKQEALLQIDFQHGPAVPTPLGRGLLYGF